MEETVLMFENFDLDNLVTPVDADELGKLLLEMGYDEGKTAVLVDGFKKGFTLGYAGPTDVKITSPNLKFQPGVGNEVELWNKVMKEVKELGMRVHLRISRSQKDIFNHR